VLLASHHLPLLGPLALTLRSDVISPYRTGKCRIAASHSSVLAFFSFGLERPSEVMCGHFHPIDKAESRTIA
jgi:hypothetical protein